jgi:hypothetical protein
MKSYHPDEHVVIVHTADTTAEAMVIRGLLSSADIDSPGSVSSDPFPLNEPPEGTHGVEIYARESQAEEAKRLISEYAKSNAETSEAADDSDEGSG